MHKPDIKTAVEIYDRNVEIGNAEIFKLFGAGKQKTAQLKNAVKAVMKARDIKTMMPHNIDTETAYEVWGININRYRQRLRQILKSEGREDTA